MSDIAVESVIAYRGLVHSLLARAAKVKPHNQVEPPLAEADLGESIWRLPQANGTAERNQQTNYAAVETAFREKFYELLVRKEFIITYYETLLMCF
jgi:THO complex subunit 1